MVAARVRPGEPLGGRRDAQLHLVGLRHGHGLDGRQLADEREDGAREARHVAVRPHAVPLHRRLRQQVHAALGGAHLAPPLRDREVGPRQRRGSHAEGLEALREGGGVHLLSEGEGSGLELGLGLGLEVGLKLGLGLGLGLELELGLGLGLELGSGLGLGLGLRLVLVHARWARRDCGIRLSVRPSCRPWAVSGKGRG